MTALVGITVGEGRIGAAGGASVAVSARGWAFQWAVVVLGSPFG